MPVDAPLPILFHDRHLVAIHKPPGMLLHRTPISRDRVFVLQTLRDQLGQRVYPVHRLDRATSGVLLFGLDPQTAQALAAQFELGRVDKRYRALVRGWIDVHGIIDHPVTDPEGDNRPREALTEYRRLAQVELPEAVDRYPTSRYSLASVVPHSGRRQQIRKHFKHISHHMIGDTTHGNGRHNRFFRQRFGVGRLLLTAQHLAFDHPVSGERIALQAGAEPDWQSLFRAFGWQQRDWDEHWPCQAARPAS
jgi:tRNA pseudouridine65 synthase